MLLPSIVIEKDMYGETEYIDQQHERIYYSSWIVGNYLIIGYSTFSMT